jgi:hypothetical protein
MPFQDPGLATDFNFESLEGLIGNRGITVVHQYATKCTCINVDPNEGAVGQPQPGCTKCYGRGYVYRDAVQMDGIIASLTFTTNFVQLGWIKPGDMTFSPSIHARDIGDFDRIRLTLPTSVEPELLVRGSATSLTPRPPGLADNEDYLKYEAGKAMAQWIEDEDDVVYSNTDYLLKGHRIIWTEGCGPAVGKKYSIKYMAFRAYIAFNPPMFRWDRDRNLGSRVMLRAETVMKLGKVIELPWEEEIEDNAFRSDDPYSTIEKPTTKPPR